MQQLVSSELEVTKNKLQEIVKPFQQEQNQRQKKADFLKVCIRSLEKSDFFQIDELLKSRLAKELLEDPYFTECDSIFSQLQTFSDEKIDQYQIEFKQGLLQGAQMAELPLEVDLPRFSVLKGIDGKVDFGARKTTINEVTLKSIDPKRIVSAALKIKRRLYDSPFEPQKFIDTLFECYQELIKKRRQGLGDVVPIRDLYWEYVWALQSKTFFQNMDKRKFKGCPIDQFTVDMWRFFSSPVSSTEGGYRIRLNAGRGNSLWLIDQEGERRHITHALFAKN